MIWLTRPMEPDDRGYIIRTWVISMKHEYPFTMMCKEAISKYSKRVEALIDTAKVLVAYDEKMPDLIYGFICYEDGQYLGVDSPTLHFAHTRFKFRKNGIASTLFHKAFPNGGKIIFTHLTKAIDYAKLREKWGLRDYDPYYVEGALYSKARKFDARAKYKDAMFRVPASNIPCGSPPFGMH